MKKKLEHCEIIMKYRKIAVELKFCSIHKKIYHRTGTPYDMKIRDTIEIRLRKVKNILPIIIIREE